MILYPTETTYVLGVNPLDPEALKRLYQCKGRAEEKSVSWLVRDLVDIEAYAVVSPVARQLATAFLPGPLTLVLPAKNPLEYGEFIGFRVSLDPVAQTVISRFMEENHAPLTCTSANRAGLEPCDTPENILRQLDDTAHLIDEVVDDGPRQGVPSTVVKVIGDDYVTLREGAISASAIKAALS